MITLVEQGYQVYLALEKWMAVHPLVTLLLFLACMLVYLRVLLRGVLALVRALLHQESKDAHKQADLEKKDTPPLEYLPSGCCEE